MTTSAPLCELAGLKDYLGIASDEHDTFLGGLIQAVGAQFAAFTGRRLAVRDYSPDPSAAAYDPDNAVLSGQGHPEFLLPQYPVQTVSSLTLDGVALAPAVADGSTGYLVERAAGLLVRLDGVFSPGRGNLRVAYRAGFDPLPADLAQAALEQTAIRFQESAHGHGRLGISAKTLADGSLSYATGALLPQVREVLERYRNRSLL